MNGIQLSILMRKFFAASFNATQQEWRFKNGDRGYALSTQLETDRSTYEPHVSGVTLLVRGSRSGENAAEDIRGSRRLSGRDYKVVSSYEKDRMTVEDLKTWIVKMVVTCEFE